MKVIDITEKLNFAEKPKIKIRDVEITINNNAVSILKVMPKANKKIIKLDDMLEIVNLLISESEMRKLEGLDLGFEDFNTFIGSAISLVTGTDDEGEAQTRITT